MKRMSLFVALVAAVLTAPSMSAQSTGPDVIVGSIIDVDNYGQSGGISAFALGTESCNIGTTPLLWQASNPNHPVIGQNLYRYLNGRFEQVGMSWLKHGFTALALSLCQPCMNPGTGTLLGVGCSDPYTAGLNGSQNGLGPRGEVNATTGAFPYPPSNPSFSGNIARRLQVANADLDPVANAGAIYFGECQYVTNDDAAAGNKNNNASHRRLNVTGSGPFTLSLASGFNTVREKGAIYAWQALDSAVQIKEIDVQDGANTGRVIVAFKASLLPNTLWHYEFAIFNLNSHRSINSVSVPFPTGATISNVGFHDVPYHSGDGNTSGTNFSGTDWTSNVSGTNVTWSTDSFVVNANANALRWGSTYNFRFDSTVPPSTTFAVNLGVYRPGTPTTVSTTFDPVSQMTIVSGNSQVANVNEPLANEFRVRVTDPIGVPQPNLNVNFTVTTGSVVLSATSATTDANGEAAISMTAGSVGGNFAVRAAVGPANVTINGFVRWLRAIWSPGSGVLVSIWQTEFASQPLIAAYDSALVAPTSTSWGTIYTSILAPQPPIVILDGIGIVLGGANPTVRTGAGGTYTKSFTGLASIVGSGFQLVSQMYAAPGYPVVSNPAFVTF